MKALDYITKLNLTARWFLPQSEAEDVVNDYREMLAGGTEDPEERFGPPLKVVLSLADRGKMIAWNLFFVGALVVHFFLIHWANNFTYYNYAALTLCAMTVGFMLQLLGGVKLRNPFKGLVKSIFVSFILLAAFLVSMFTPAYYLLRFYHNSYPWYYDSRFYSFLYGCVVFFTLCSVAAIILARLVDRRWRAISILCLTIVCVALYFLKIFQNRDPGSSDPVVDVVLLNPEGIFMGAAGVITAGMGLC